MPMLLPETQRRGKPPRPVRKPDFQNPRTPGVPPGPASDGSTHDARMQDDSVVALSSSPTATLVQSRDTSSVDLSGSAPDSERIDHSSTVPTDSGEEKITRLSPTLNNHDLGATDRMPRTYPIIYKLACYDLQTAGVRIDRYDEKPFEGFGFGFDNEEDTNRQDLAIMDVCIVSHGTFPDGRPRRRNQSRKFFGTDLLEDNSEAFMAGLDFIPRLTQPAALRIFSMRVLGVLRNMVKYFPGLDLTTNEFVVEHPYEVLIYHYDELQAFAGTDMPSGDERVESGVQDSLHHNKDDEVLTRQHVNVVLQWLQPYYEKHIMPELEAHGCGSASFMKLWLLYKPGTTVFAFQGGQIAFYKVESIRCNTEQELWQITVWGLDFNGSRFIRSAHDFTISQYRDQKPIRSFELVPVRYMSEADGNEKSLIKRGKSFYKMICEAPIYRQYNGNIGGKNDVRYSGGVIIDPLKSTERLSTGKRKAETLLGTVALECDEPSDYHADFKQPNDMGGGPLYSKFNDVAYSRESELEDVQMYLLMPGQLWGFALGKKQWAKFDVEGFVEPNANPMPLRNLVIDGPEFELIAGLARSGGPDDEPFWRADFVDGKGLGQVILLHGPPGVGKSFTVECLAEQMQRPLLTLTVADLGTAETVGEQRLSGWLDLAQRWKAVVLIDEADIYLAKRSRNDIARNALVTAFLRALEYYPGMLFLTTNQPAYIDDAFISRFHLVIEYQSLDQEKRKKIWLNFIHNLLAEQDTRGGKGPNVSLLGDVQNYLTTDQELRELELNGRDIRNAFHGAVKLAVFQAEKQFQGRPVQNIELTIEHFEKVVKNKSAYRRYLKSVSGRDEDGRALDDQARRS